MVAKMERVKVTVSEKTFELSKEILENRSQYLRHLISKGKPLDLSEFSVNACEVLFTYLEQQKIDFNNHGTEFLITVLETAELLAIESYAGDLEEALKQRWHEIKSLETVMGLADALGVREQLVTLIISQVLGYFLQDGSSPLNECDLSHEILLFLTKMDSFWEHLSTRCAYYFTFEVFYENVFLWILKTDAVQNDVRELLNALKLHTLPEKFLIDSINSENSSLVPEILRSTVEMDVRLLLEGIYTSIKKLVSNIETVFIANQNCIVVKGINDNGDGWHEELRASNLSFTPVACVRSEDQTYILGEKRMMRVPFKGDELGADIDTEFPEVFVIQKVCMHENKVFVFADTLGGLALYVYDQETNRFSNVSSCPVQKNIAVVSHATGLYVVGEVWESVLAFRFDVETSRFVELGATRKCLRKDAEPKKVLYYSKNEIVVVNNVLCILTFEWNGNTKHQIHLRKINLCPGSANSMQVLKVDLPTHSLTQPLKLLTTGSSGDNLFLIFKSNYNGDLSLAVLNLASLVLEYIGHLPSVSIDKYATLTNVILYPHSQLYFEQQMIPQEIPSNASELELSIVEPCVSLGFLTCPEEANAILNNTTANPDTNVVPDIVADELYVPTTSLKKDNAVVNISFQENDVVTVIASDLPTDETDLEPNQSVQKDVENTQYADRATTSISPTVENEIITLSPNEGIQIGNEQARNVEKTLPVSETVDQASPTPVLNNELPVNQSRDNNEEVAEEALAQAPPASIRPTLANDELSERQTNDNSGVPQEEVLNNACPPKPVNPSSLNQSHPEPEDLSFGEKQIYFETLSTTGEPGATRNSSELLLDRNGNHVDIESPEPSVGNDCNNSEQTETHVAAAATPIEKTENCSKERRADEGIRNGLETKPEDSNKSDELVYDEPSRYFTTPTLRANYPLPNDQSPDQNSTTPLEPHTVATRNQPIVVESLTVYKPRYSHGPLQQSSPRSDRRYHSGNSSPFNSDNEAPESYNSLNLDVVDSGKDVPTGRRVIRKQREPKKSKKRQVLDLITSLL